MKSMRMAFSLRYRQCEPQMFFLQLIHPSQGFFDVNDEILRARGRMKKSRIFPTSHDGDSEIETDFSHTPESACFDVCRPFFKLAHVSFVQGARKIHPFPKSFVTSGSAIVQRKQNASICVTWSGRLLLWIHSQQGRAAKRPAKPGKLML